MRAFDTRTAVTALAVLVALGTLVGPVAAGDGEVGIEVDADPTGNSTVDAGYTATESAGGSDGSVECHGSPADHECDKGGNLSAGPLGVDYDGYNDDNASALRGGGGDRFEVGAGDEWLLVGFDCALNTSVSPDSCATGLNSSQGQPSELPAPVP